MKRLLLVSIVFLAAYCSSGGGGSAQSTAQPGHGSITIQIVPNPIVAQHVSGSTYSFPFDAVVRETGGRPVSITRISADVNAFGGIHVASESYDVARISSLGYGTQLAANGELRYHFAPQKEVADERLFSSVSAVLRVDAVDDTGTPASAQTTVTVMR
jgi:hypothetical protein